MAPGLQNDVITNFPGNDTLRMANAYGGLIYILVPKVRPAPFLYCEVQTVGVCVSRLPITYGDDEDDHDVCVDAAHNGSLALFKASSALCATTVTKELLLIYV